MIYVEEEDIRRTQLGPKRFNLSSVILLILKIIIKPIRYNCYIDSLTPVTPFTLSFTLFNCVTTASGLSLSQWQLWEISPPVAILSGCQIFKAPVVKPEVTFQ